MFASSRFSFRRLRSALRGLAVAPIAVGLALLLVASVLAQAGDRPRVDVVRVDGEITPPMAGYIERAIAAAGADGSAAVVLELDTPGGLATAMDDIVDAIVASPTPVIVYVAPQGARAASAGVFITYAAHVAAMAPGTRIGSASPITIGDNGQTGQDATLTAKITNDAVSQIKNLAALHGRNADWAEQAVRSAANVTADEAAKLKVVDLIAPDVPSLLDQVDGRTVQTAAGPTTLRTAGAEVRPVEMGWMDGLLQLLANPTIAYILLSLGSLGLFLELSNPGAIVPGVAGGLCLLLGLYGLGTLPVNWTGVLLIAFGFVLFAVDLFVPSFGSLTVGGVISFLLGSYLLLGSDAPPGMQISPLVIWTTTALLVGFFLFLGGSVLQARFRKPATGREALLGSVGTVRQPLRPDGVVFVGGELWQATAAPELVPQGLPIPDRTAVVVQQLDGLRLVVRPATAAEAAAAGVAVIDDRRPAAEAARAPVAPALATSHPDPAAGAIAAPADSQQRSPA